MFLREGNKKDDIDVASFNKQIKMLEAEIEEGKTRLAELLKIQRKHF